MTTDVQRLTNDVVYEEVTDETNELLHEAITNDLINDEAFRLFIQGSMEQYLNESMSHQELNSILKEVYKDANNRFNTSYAMPRIHDLTKRVKRCAHCEQLFYDATKRNQSVCCSREIAFDSNGKMLFRNGVILTQCLRELKAGERRSTPAIKSVSEYRLVSLDKLQGAIAEDGTVFAKRKKSTTFTNDFALKYFDSYMNAIKDTSELDSKTLNDILPSEPVSELQYKRDRERYLLTE